MLMKIKLAKACRRREKGAVMMVPERAAYHMMDSGEAVVDREFMAVFAKSKNLPMNKLGRPDGGIDIEGKKKRGRPRKDEKS